MVPSSGNTAFSSLKMGTFGKERDTEKGVPGIGR